MKEVFENVDIRKTHCFFKEIHLYYHSFILFIFILLFIIIMVILVVSRALIFR